MRTSLMIVLAIAIAAAVGVGAYKTQRSGTEATATAAAPAWMAESRVALETELLAQHGAAQRPRIERGLRQAGEFWRATDGDADAFATFVRSQFAGDQVAIDTLFNRLQTLFEQLDGHLQEIGRAFREQSDLDRGPVQGYDEIAAAYDPSAHVLDDFFANKLAFTVLLNFPITALEERLRDGEQWSRRQWAETRLAERFSKRVPASVNQQMATAYAAADHYIAGYNIWMHHLLGANSERLFPKELRLLSHWNLRDQIKSDYGDVANGLARQRMIQQVMERIVTQTIPAAVIDNPQLDWNPVSNEVTPTSSKDSDHAPKGAAGASNAPEPDTRYAVLLKDFQAMKLADPYSPTAPTHIARRFDEDRQIPEERVKQMLEQVLSSPLVPQVAELIKQRLGRTLEPFDIWYSGFRPGTKYGAAELDRMVARRYPNPAAYERDIPRQLTALGFTPERARYLATHIAVDPARGSGHAMGAAMRSAKARLRTRVEERGMNYKGYNIAVHELGHNVEQTISLNDIDYTLLQGVPNTAFTEALAFVFQARDLQLLGLQQSDPLNAALATLNDFWATFEIAGVALVDMAVWHWLYEHPEATPATLKEATLTIARDVWNRYYAPVFGQRDVVLLAIYSHMINSFLYLPDYPIGHLIAHQIEEQVNKSGQVGPEFERMARAGNITPDLWMINATGKPVGAEALLEAAQAALARLQ